MVGIALEAHSPLCDLQNHSTFQWEPASDFHPNTSCCSSRSPCPCGAYDACKPHVGRKGWLEAHPLSFPCMYEQPSVQLPWPVRLLFATSRSKGSWVPSILCFSSRQEERGGAGRLHAVLLRAGVIHPLALPFHPWLGVHVNPEEAFGEKHARPLSGDRPDQ